MSLMLFMAGLLKPGGRIAAIPTWSVSGLRFVELAGSLGLLATEVSNELFDTGQQARILLGELLFVPLDLGLLFFFLFHDLKI